MCSDAGGFHLTVSSDGATVGRFDALVELGRSHAVTTRRGFDVALAQADPGAAADALGRSLTLGGAAWLNQVHGARVIEVHSPGAAGDGDGIVTDTEALGLVGRSADCPLVLVADKAGEAVGMFHAGWRGCAGGIAGELISRLARRFGTDASGLVACICPSAGPCCYEVGRDVYEAVLTGMGAEAARLFDRRGERLYFDMAAAIRYQLIGAGVGEENVHQGDLCTMCRNDLFPSYRLEGERAGRFGAIIAKKQPPGGQNQQAREGNN
jgi:YfiH family protein